MLLSHVSTPIFPGAEPLLRRRDTTNILRCFDVTARRSVCSSVVGQLNRTQRHSRPLLDTVAHVTWAMECVGHTLSLPIESKEDTNIMDGAVSIYERWFGLTDHPELDMPPPMRHDGDAEKRVTEQRFLRDMLDHLTQAFRDRSPLTSPLFLQHVQLCRRILELMWELSLRRAEELTVETWERALRGLLGVCDSLLEKKEERGSLANELCAPLVRVLLGMWMRSGTRNPVMWALLARISRRWTHRTTVVLQVRACVSVRRGEGGGGERVITC
jgi:hypothetical protein